MTRKAVATRSVQAMSYPSEHGVGFDEWSPFGKRLQERPVGRKHARDQIADPGQALEEFRQGQTEVTCAPDQRQRSQRDGNAPSSPIARRPGVPDDETRALLAHAESSSGTWLEAGAGCVGESASSAVSSPG